MKNLERFFGLALILALCLPVPSLAEDLAQVDVSAAALRWDLQGGDFEKAVLTVSMPDGKVVRREFKAGELIVFELGTSMQDGSYAYELRGVPRIDAAVRRELAAARRSGNEAAAIERLQAAGKLPREGAVQSGSFLVQAGSIVPRDLRERPETAAGTGGGPQIITAADQVIPDDLIVQQSLCVGFDCVNGESFGFDTIRLKENNTRIKFEDTSTGTFPSNDWQLTANDSASGGQNKFSIEDITGAKVPFTIEAGATTNSVYVDSTGRVGFRTSTPVLDLHIATSNTPGIRLEQNSSGGFTAQTWDIAGNEANFFVRDVTSGSRLPFRIRPGAPTSSIDISADGDVGIGTASPDDRLHVQCSAAGQACVTVENDDAAGFAGFQGLDDADVVTFFLGVDNAGNSTRINSVNSHPLIILTNGTERIRFPAPGTDFIQATNGAELTAGGVWQDNSSRDSKRDIVELSDEAARQAFRDLKPVTFRYKTEPDEQYVGFIAEELPDLVASSDRKHMNATDVVAVLTKVVQDQQKTIDELNTRLSELEKQKN